MVRLPDKILPEAYKYCLAVMIDEIVNHEDFLDRSKVIANRQYLDDRILTISIQPSPFILRLETDDAQD